jgi:hypothetical protein
MKTLYLSVVFFFVSLAVMAQPIMTLKVGVYFTIPNGDSFTSPIPVPQGTVETFDFIIQNTGSSDLVLSKTGDVYISLTGNAASYVDLDETTITTSTIASNGTVSFSVTSKETMPAGSYTLSFSIANNTTDKNPYTGSISFTVTPSTGTLTPEAAGISLVPNPSTDGRLKIKGSLPVNKVVVYGMTGTSEEFEGGSTFHTRQKGLLIVHLHTERGIVVDKINVQ